MLGRLKRMQSVIYKCTSCGNFVEKTPVRYSKHGTPDFCPECRDVDTLEDVEEDACQNCAGSGEGYVDGSTCQTCGGCGVEKLTLEEHQENYDPTPACHICVGQKCNCPPRPDND